MQKVVYYCDATNKKLSDEEVIANQALIMKFLSERPSAKIRGTFSENCLPYVEEYWTEYEKVLDEAFRNFNKAINDHCVKFFQRKLANESKKHSGPGGRPDKAGVLTGLPGGKRKTAEFPDPGSGKP